MTVEELIVFNSTLPSGSATLLDHLKNIRVEREVIHQLNASVANPTIGVSVAEPVMKVSIKKDTLNVTIKDEKSVLSVKNKLRVST